MTQKTHREVKVPTVSARFLADYMAASPTAQRTIIGGCKYQTLARVFQHDEARMTVGKFMRATNPSISSLDAKAEELRGRIADSEFDRTQLDVNADYIAQFAKVAHLVQLPKADAIEGAGNLQYFHLNGVRVNPQLIFKLRRKTKTNKVMIGGGCLRYAKGVALKEEIALWQSAFIHGYLKATSQSDEAVSDVKLCVTLDAYTGSCFPAPTDAVRRFQHMSSACATIAERWPNIQPPKGAVL